MSDTHGVEPDDTSEVNSQISFAIGVVEDKENIEICPTNNAVDKKIEGGQNNESTISGSGLPCTTTHLLVRKRHGFHGSKSENTLSSVSVLQPKSLYFHYFTLKVTCFLQFFVNLELQLFCFGINSITSFFSIMQRRVFC